MIKKGYRLVSIEDTNPLTSFDEHNFGGKKMWDERLETLDSLTTKIFTYLFTAIAVAILVDVGVLIFNLITLKEVGYSILVFVISLVAVIVSGIISSIFLKIIMHHIKSQEIFYANMTINKENTNHEERL